jgi:hypothetical protein
MIKNFFKHAVNLRVTASKFLVPASLLALAITTGISCKPSTNDEGANTEGVSFQDASKFASRMLGVFSRNADNAYLLHTNVSNAERLKVISRIPVSEILSAPGHLKLRRPEAVREMAKIIEAAGDGGKSFVKGKEKIVLNVFTKVVTSEDGKTQKVAIRGIEVMDGNHRLAAGLLARMGEAQDHLAAGLHAKRAGAPVWQFVGDIPPEAVEVRVNGDIAFGGGKPNRWIPSKIFNDASCTGPCADLKNGRRGWFRILRDDRGGEAAEVSGGLSSLDEVIPQKFRGHTMYDVLQQSLSSGK